MRVVYVIILVLGFFQLANSQSISGDQNWQTEEDFKGAENNVIENILWLEENPLSTSSNDTKAITEYVLNWLSNNPYMSVTYDEIFLEGLKNSKKYKFGEKFRVTYLFGKSFYVLSLPDQPDEAMSSARGIEGMVKVYQELKKVDPSVKHRALEKYSRLYNSSKVLEFTHAQLAKQGGVQK